MRSLLVLALLGAVAVMLWSSPVSSQCARCSGTCHRVGSGDVELAAIPLANLTVSSDLPAQPAVLTVEDVAYLEYRLKDRSKFADKSLLAAAIEEYSRFVMLAAQQTQSADEADRQLYIAPSPLVDSVWHAHILHTARYHAMCRRAFGGEYLHHAPEEPTGTADHFKALVEQYKFTLRQYEKFFGTKPRTDIWPEPASTQAEEKFIKLAGQ